MSKHWLQLTAGKILVLLLAHAGVMVLIPASILNAHGRGQGQEAGWIAQSQAGPAAAGLMDQAAAAFTRADYPAAIAAWTQVIMARPAVPIANEALMNRSKAYLVVGQPALALADLDAVRYQPKDVAALAEVWLLRGSTYLQSKQYAEAIAAFAQSERLQSRNPILLANRSVAYQSLGRLAEAKADITAAIKLQPSFSNYFNLAVLERLSGNPQGCYGLLTQMIGQSQPYAQLFMQRGLCAAALARHDDAISDMLKALKLDPSNVEAIEQLGLSLAAKNQKESAKQYLLKASSIRLANGQVEDYQKLLAKIATLDQR